VNPLTGALSPIGGSPFSVPNVVDLFTNFIVVDPSGALLYAVELVTPSAGGIGTPPRLSRPKATPLTPLPGR
jgi:hypothetical protein